MSINAWRFSNFYFFYFFTVGIMVPYWSLYLQHLQFTPAQIGELTAILVLTKMIAPNLLAWIADTNNARHGNAFAILKISTAASLLACVTLYFFVKESSGNLYWTVAGIMFVYSVFWNACLPQMEAATLKFLGSSRHRYGSIRLWGSIGFIVAVLALGYLLDHFSPNIILHAVVIGLLLMFVSSLLLNSNKLSNPSPVNTHKVPLAKLLNARVLLVLFLCTLMQLSHAPFYTFFSIYLEGYGYSKASIGWLWVVGVVVEIAIFAVGVRLLRHYRLMSLLTFTFATACVRWFMVARYPDQLWLIFLAQLLHAVTYGLNHSVMMQLIDSFFQGHYQVRGQALYSSVTFGVGGALGSVLSGYIWSIYGGNILFYAAAVLMLVATVMAKLTLTTEQQQLPVKEM